MISGFYANGNYVWAPGDVISITGETTEPMWDYYLMTAPTSGTYTAYLASQWDGSILSAPLTVVINAAPAAAVPEPSSGCTSFAG